VGPEDHEVVPGAVVTAATCDAVGDHGLPH
jgi:hypothetical protein